MKEKMFSEANYSGVDMINDKYIRVILLPIGITLSVWIMKGFSAGSVIQGILVTGAAVYGNQLIKQISKE
ncbi:phage holin family protein [Clostridium sp.]|uniref:phage holin family protein n=1 Tax=Clostridium sp. TaxID=1506 RepID=UPI0032167A34